jgi:hypothetical protein
VPADQLSGAEGPLSVLTAVHCNVTTLQSNAAPVPSLSRTIAFISHCYNGYYYFFDLFAVDYL